MSQAGVAAVMLETGRRPTELPTCPLRVRWTEKLSEMRDFRRRSEHFPAKSKNAACTLPKKVEI